jgi:hypothetical protein
VDDGWSTSSRFTISLRDGRTFAVSADGSFFTCLPGPSLTVDTDIAWHDLPRT